MHQTITVKFEASTKEELMNTFPSTVAAVREQYDLMHKEGVFGPPENVTMRYLIIGGKWQGNLIQQEQPQEG